MSLPNNLLNILLVEDDEDDYLLTQEFLIDAYGSGQHKLDWCQNYKDGLENLKKNPDKYDVILLDFFIGAQTG